MDPDYARRLGVNVNELLISQPNSGEEALNILESLVRSGIISVVVVGFSRGTTPWLSSKERWVNNIWAGKQDDGSGIEETDGDSSE